MPAGTPREPGVITFYVDSHGARSGGEGGRPREPLRGAVQPVHDVDHLYPKETTGGAKSSGSANEE